MKYIFLLLAVILVFTNFTQGQSVQLISTYRGATCSASQNVASIYSDIGICTNTGCVGATYSGESYSLKTECVSSIPTSPNKGYYMISTYSDVLCKKSATTSSIFAINTCIPVNNQTYGSVKYIGCSQMVQYVDSGCATVQQTQPTATASCLFGISVQCNSVAKISVVSTALISVIGFILAFVF